MAERITLAQGGVSLGEEMPIGPGGDLRGWLKAAIQVQSGGSSVDRSG